MTIKEFKDSIGYNQSKCDANDNNIIKLPDDQISLLEELFKDWLNRSDELFVKEAGNLIENIIKKPDPTNGKVYEALIYSWLTYNYIDFKPQQKIESCDCFKNNNVGYEADGVINENQIVFDVKQFGITWPHLKTLKVKIQENKNFPKNDYELMISGGMNMSNKEFQKTFLDKIDDIIDNLFRKENKIVEDYICKFNGLEFRAWKIDGKRIMSSLSEVDPYEWAENNEYYFIHHSSQFCISDPYILFCPFDSVLLPGLVNDKNALYLAFRSLCRRMFMHLIRVSDRTINEFDGKGRQDITVSTAAKKISAIAFIDVSKKTEYCQSNNYVFINPNADNKILNYMINSLFRLPGAVIDDFRFDNY